MQTILTLTEKDVYPENIITPEEQYIAPRRAVRAIIFDNDNNVALEGFIEQRGNLLYSVIGGGIDEGETTEEALIREALEEAGCHIKNIHELGIVEERGIGTKEGARFLQTNYCFIAEVDGEKMETKFTEEEKRRGYHCIWRPLEEAIAILKAQHTGFMTRKALFLLEEANRLRML